MTVRKSNNRIAAENVPSVFDAACINRLANISKFPAEADLVRFGKGVQAAALIYARDSRELNANELHAEISALHKAAERHDHETLAKLLTALSPQARERLNDIGNPVDFNFELPDPDTMFDVRHRAAACERVASLCRYGGKWIEGRRRPSGKRSRTWRWDLYAPAPSPAFEKRSAERAFVTWLRFAWSDATGQLASKTANPNKKGPFARLATECLRLVGAEHADAIALINGSLEHQRRRRQQRRNVTVT